MLTDYLDSDSVKQQAIVAGYSNVETYVMNLIDKDRERHAIKKGLDEIAAGKARPFEEFDAEFRKRHGIAIEP